MAGPFSSVKLANFSAGILSILPARISFCLSARYNWSSSKSLLMKRSKNLCGCVTGLILVESSAALIVLPLQEILMEQYRMQL